MRSKFLILLLVVSLIANAYFVLFEEQPALEGEQIQKMQDQINTLEVKNENLQSQLDQNNESLQSYASQMDSYRTKVYELQNGTLMCPTGVEGFATLEAPAVFQPADSTSPFIRQSSPERGALMNISVEIRPGKGRVLVQTTPLMGVVFQDAANTAVYLAESRTGKQLSSSDIIFSISAPDEVPGVDGPSAGALMTLLAISAIDNATLNDNITLTGTIDNEGYIGAIGGAVEKAQAAKEGGKTLFLIPEENSELVTYELVERKIGGFTIVERQPQVVDAEQYIEENVGINVEYVNTIDDVLRFENIRI